MIYIINTQTNTAQETVNLLCAIKETIGKMPVDCINGGYNIQIHIAPIASAEICTNRGCTINDDKRWCHAKQKEVLLTDCNDKCNYYTKI